MASGPCRAPSTLVCRRRCRRPLGLPTTRATGTRSCSGLSTPTRSHSTPRYSHICLVTYQALFIAFAKPSYLRDAWHFDVFRFTFRIPSNHLTHHRRLSFPAHRKETVTVMARLKKKPDPFQKTKKPFSPAPCKVLGKLLLTDQASPSIVRTSSMSSMTGPLPTTAPLVCKQIFRNQKKQTTHTQNLHNQTPTVPLGSFMIMLPSISKSQT